jgi:hypothetical protein
MSRREINWSRWPAILWLTLVFWLFTFVVFQAPALRTGRVTVWETTAYLAIIASGFVFSIGLCALARALRGVAGRRRLGVMLAAALAAAVVHSALDHEAFVVSAKLFGAPNQLPALIDGFVFNILIYVWIYGLYVAGLELVTTSARMREQERRLAAAQAAAQTAQLAALRFQINPHFLFNALNAVTALIGADRKVEAEAVVIRLSEFFRASLVLAPGDLVSLEEELDITGSYLDIEAARFGDRLAVEIEFAEPLRRALVPHFILQPLAENAIKHGVAQAKRPVTITIRARAAAGRLVLTVADDAAVAPAATAANGTGVGLANVQARLEALFGERACLRTSSIQGCYTAELVMPLQIDQQLREGELACVS